MFPDPTEMNRQYKKEKRVYRLKQTFNLFTSFVIYLFILLCIIAIACNVIADLQYAFSLGK
jgi:hypothetical protein